MVEPLIPSAQYHSFVKALSLPNQSRKKCVLKILVGKLPTDNCTVLRLLVDFLRKYTSSSAMLRAAAALDDGDSGRGTHKPCGIEVLSSLLSQHILRPGKTAGRGADSEAPGDSSQVRRFLVELVGDRDSYFRHNLSRVRATEVHSKVLSTENVDKNVFKKHAHKISTKMAQITKSHITALAKSNKNLTSTRR